MSFASLIDHTLLKPDATAAQIDQLCQEATQFGFHAVCVNPYWVTRAAERLRGTTVKVCTVIGFPLGATPTEIKAAEARRAIADGAAELDMVLNIGALKSSDEAAVLADLQAVTELCRQHSTLSKLILETHLLTHSEKIRACELAIQAGLNFVKTSTGFTGGGATVEDVHLLTQVVKPAGLGVKASGGIRSLADLQKMIAAGATRIGTSSGVKIMLEAAGQPHTDRPGSY